MVVPESSLVLPEGSRVLHIGPHKTGTTSLQLAFHRNRRALTAQGVQYVGRRRHAVDEVLSLLAREQETAPAFSPDTDKPWRRLMMQQHASTASRTFLSSEFFADARPSAIRAVVDDLGADRIQVLVTLRPLARLMPSQWQQYVQGGMTSSYDKWLGEMLRKKKSKVSPTFWWRHRHDELVARWIDAVGVDRVTVLVVDETDRNRLFRDVEGLLGLAPETLVIRSNSHGNRSMTAAEIEIVRHFNLRFQQAGLSRHLYQQVMRTGAARYIQSRPPEPDEGRLTTPQWALQRAGEIGDEMARAIEKLGVRVVGDLGTLGVVPENGRADGEPLEVVISPEVAATAAMGVLYSSGLLDLAHDGEPPVTAPGLRRLPTVLLARNTLRRGRWRARRSARRYRRKMRRFLRLRRPAPARPVVDDTATADPTDD